MLGHLRESRSRLKRFRVWLFSLVCFLLAFKPFPLFGISVDVSISAYFQQVFVTVSCDFSSLSLGPSNDKTDSDNICEAVLKGKWPVTGRPDV